jgi:hypothetical protein
MFHFSIQLSPHRKAAAHPDVENNGAVSGVRAIRRLHSGWWPLLSSAVGPRGKGVNLGSLWWRMPPSCPLRTNVGRQGRAQSMQKSGIHRDRVRMRFVWWGIPRNYTRRLRVASNAMWKPSKSPIEDGNDEFLCLVEKKTTSILQ